MKASDFITRLDQARYGRRVSEDAKPVAEKPSHAPTSTAEWKTKSGMGKSEDEGEEVKKAYKQPSGSIPAPVAPAPSHAPTSGKDATTTGQGKSEDEGEKISKEAIKETVRQLIDGDSDIDLDSLLGEGGHKAGCQCGFCKNKGKMGKKKEEDGGEDKDDVQEAYGVPPMRRPMAPPAPQMRRKMGFRSQVPRPKAAINPYQPAMEHAGKNFQKGIQEAADKLLDSPGD